MRSGLQGVGIVLFGAMSFAAIAHEATSPIMPVVDGYTGWETKKRTLSEANELPIWQLPNVDRAVESYFSPDSKQLIFYAKSKASEAYHINIASIDGRSVREINDVGNDACSFFFPDNKRVVFTSTMDNMDMPRGNWSKVGDYPQGAELYTANVDGSNVKRLTNNRQYDAEVSVSPDGEWVLFTRETNGMLDLWRVRPDGSDEIQVTHTPDMQEGGAFYMPDSETIIFRAWSKAKEHDRNRGMDIYTVKHDGSELTRITNDGQVNWAPYPAPDRPRAGEIVKQMIPVAGANGPLLGEQFFGETAQYFQRRVLVVQKNIAPHGRVRCRNTGEIPKTGGRIIHHFGVGHAA